MQKKILVTGGAGFMGSNFVKYLLANYPDYRVIVLDALTYAGCLDNFSDSEKNSPGFKFWHGNVRNDSLVNKLVSEVDVVVHFAAETHVSRSIYDDTIFFETDVLGTQVIANAAVGHGIERFIHISSSEVYGTTLIEPMDEDHPLNPRTPYASAKAGADRLVYSYIATYGLPAIILRPFNNYGPYQHLEKAIPRFITSAILNEPLTIHGTGYNTRDWLFVTDLCQAVCQAIHIDIDKIKGEAINIGTGKETDIEAIAKIILKKMNKPMDLLVYVPDRQGQVARHISSTKKAKQLLEWEAKTEFETGIEKTINWYLSNENWWRRLLWMRTVVTIDKNGQEVIH